LGGDQEGNGEGGRKVKMRIGGSINGGTKSTVEIGSWREHNPKHPHNFERGREEKPQKEKKNYGVIESKRRKPRSCEGGETLRDSPVSQRKGGGLRTVTKRVPYKKKRKVFGMRRNDERG